MPGIRLWQLFEFPTWEAPIDPAERRSTVKSRDAWVGRSNRSWRGRGDQPRLRSSV